MRRPARIVTVLALLPLLVACSGGDALSKQEFIRQADAICNEFDDKLADARPPTTIEGIKDFAQQTQDLMSDALSQLRELEPPGDDRETVDAMLSNLERVTSLLPELADAAQQQDLQRIQELNGEFTTQVNEFNDRAESYGLEVCGSTSPGG
jgi:hypothetical protein